MGSGLNVFDGLDSLFKFWCRVRLGSFREWAGRGEVLLLLLLVPGKLFLPAGDKWTKEDCFDLGPVSRVRDFWCCMCNVSGYVFFHKDWLCDMPVVRLEDSLVSIIL